MSKTKQLSAETAVPLRPFVGPRIPRQPHQVGQAFQKRLHNRRVMARSLSDGTTEFKFKRLTSEGISTQRIVLTDEAVQAMQALWFALKRSNTTVQRRETAEEKT